MKTVILSLGGSTIVPEEVDIEFLKKFKALIDDFTSENRVVIVCGGGKVCRKHQDAAKEISKISDDNLDWIGLTATRLNAELVRSIFGESAYEKVIIDPNEIAETDKKIIIGAGWKPGFSSDMDAVLLAKQYDAKEVLNISNIDAVYSEDPKKNPNAEKFDKLSWDEFFGIIGEEWKPGMNAPFDPIASKEAKEAGITVKILNGELDNIKACIEEKEFSGTTIQ